MGAGRVVSGFGTAGSRSCSREGSHAIVAGTRGCSEPRCRHLLVCSGISRTEFNPAGPCHLRNLHLVHRHAAVGRRHHGGTCGLQGPSQRRRLRPQLTAGTPGRRPALSATHDHSLRWSCASRLTGASRDIVEHRDCHQGLDGSFRPPRDPRQESGPALLKSMRANEGRLCGTESHNLCARSGSTCADHNLPKQPFIWRFYPTAAVCCRRLLAVPAISSRSRPAASGDAIHAGAELEAPAICALELHILWPNMVACAMKRRTAVQMSLREPTAEARRVTRSSVASSLRSAGASRRPA